MAAGEGSRMRSETPKLLHPLCGRPMIGWLVAAAKAAGAGRVVVVEGPRRELEPVLDHGVQFAVQERPLGTADAVKAAASEINGAGTVIVANGDHPLISAATIQALADAHERSGAGAAIVDPNAAVIDVDVEVEADAVIAPFSSLHGSTKIGAGSTIGPGSTLIDATVGRRSKVIHSYINEAEIGDGVSVGPFAYLRPGTVMRDGSKAGTFVEIKNSDVGSDSKVPHLSYIGDTDVGAGTNLGASTITANYDGYRKH